MDLSKLVKDVLADLGKVMTELTRSMSSAFE